MRCFVKLAVLSAISLSACNCRADVSFLDADNFGQHWTVESESDSYSVEFKDGYCELVAPKGLTMWRNEKLSGNIAIEYDACVFEEKEGDRLSDLNCFWMASDPRTGDIFGRMEERHGVFGNCASLQLYYVGYGGNHNSTTRFRRYNGEPGPAIIKEYTDSGHLLQPNHWYHIKLQCRDGNVQYWIDGECLVDWNDPEPLREGWFGFRTTLSRTGIKNFKYTNL